MEQVFPWITPAVLIGGLFGLWRLLEAMHRDFRQEIGEARQTMHRNIGAVSRDIAELRERMARLEWLFEGRSMRPAASDASGND